MAHIRNQPSRNQLLMLSKKDLIKKCKKQSLSTFGCLAKMDFVKLLLDSNDSNDSKSSKHSNTNSKDFRNPNIKRRKKKKKTLSLSEPVPVPVDPSDMQYIVAPVPDNDEDNGNGHTEAMHSVQFSDLPWKMDDLKINDNSTPTGQEKTGVQNWEATAISPKNSKEIVTILPGWGSVNRSLNTVFTEDLKEVDSDDEETDMFTQIDRALGDYYKSFQRKDYFNESDEGKFLLFIKDKGLDNIEEFEKYFGSETDLEVTQCKYLGFDDKFPLNEYAPLADDDEYDKDVMTMIEIYNVIEYCYQHRKSPY